MQMELAQVRNHQALTGCYRVLELKAPAVTATARPGQFVHLLVPRLDASVLRRPFSIYDVRGHSLFILYKQVGKGTEAMASLRAGDEVSLLGPLGNGFPSLQKCRFPVMVAGGFGVAPLYYLARMIRRKGLFFVGGASRVDVLLQREIRGLKWDLRIATNDGSLGEKGFVTAILESWMRKLPAGIEPEFFVCGPEPMLKAVGALAVQGGWTAWLSLDKHMGCGVGACLACVQKIRLPDGTEELARVCREGPVFEARQIVWGGGPHALPPPVLSSKKVHR